MADQSGFDAVTNPSPEGPLAIPTIIRGANGRPQTVLVDAKTGIPVTNLAGYTIWDGGNNYYDPATGQPVAPPKAADPVPLPKKEEREPHESSDTGSSSKSVNPTASNNFGYMSKPGWLGAAGLLPGAPGLITKAANVAINANNSSATNSAREMLGLEKTSSLKGALKDNKGHVADVNINNNDYSVGFEALSPKGNTNLTPTEANNRANQLGGLSEIGTRKTGPDGQKAKGPIGQFLDKITGGTTTTGSKPTGSLASRVTGLEKGWLGDAISDALGVGKKSTPTSTSRPASGATTLSPVDPKTGQRTVTGPNGQPVNPGYGTSSPDYNPNPATNGKGLANLAPGGVRLFENYGDKRPNRPNTDILESIGTSIKEVFGSNHSIGGISGMEDAGNQYGSTRHKTGNALDFDVIGPDGKVVTDVNKLNDMASQFALANPTAGIGFGKGYMSPGRMHLDLTGQGKNWGAGGASRNMDPALAQTIDAARNGFNPTPFSNAPSPTARPTSTGNSFASQDERRNTGLDPVGSSLDPVSTSSVFDTVSPNDSYGKKTVANSVQNTTSGDRFAGVDLSKASPAQMASLGLTERTQAQKDLMAKTIAGELSPQSLKELAAGNPTARAELASIVTTMENRAGSTKYGGNLEKVLSPSQYNSLMTSNLGVTNANMNKYGPALTTAVNDFYTGANKPPSWDPTSYYNPDISNPGWGPKMTNPAMTGQHMFGSLTGPGDYGISKDVALERERLAKAQVETTRGWTPDLGANRPASSTAHSLERERDTSLSGKPSNSGLNSGLNSAGNRATGAGPMSSSNKATSSNDRSPGAATSTSGGGYSNHSTERERDTSLGGGGSKTSSSSSKGLGGTSKGVGTSKSPTNDGGGGKKSPGGGF